MWLINTTTLQLEEIINPKKNSYAIISHRWRQDELTFKDIKKGRGQQKQGYRKLEALCRIALENQLQYAWMDTCCINKDSSAELSEAINSMYRWYADSYICIAYLDDVTTTPGETVNRYDPREKTQFCSSEWWTRGWTLQELLAPKTLDFYNAHWHYLGNRVWLRKFAATASEIAEKVIETFDEPRGISDSRPPSHHFSIAQRLSWAANRNTTRIEDQAYSLMGFFNVNMTPLYGEGTKAFLRLQQEIINNSDDQSIFAWSSTKPGIHGMLAPDVSCFRFSRNVRLPNRWEYDDQKFNREPYQFLNGALLIQLPIRALLNVADVYTADLPCFKVEIGIVTQCRIILVRIGSSDPPTFARLVSAGMHQRKWIMGEGSQLFRKIPSQGERTVQQLRIPEPTLSPTALERKHWGISDVQTDEHESIMTIANPAATACEGAMELEPGRSGPIVFAQNSLRGHTVLQSIAHLSGINSTLNPELMLFDNRHWPNQIRDEEFLARFGLRRPDNDRLWAPDYWFQTQPPDNTPDGNDSNVRSRLKRPENGKFWPPDDWANTLAPKNTPDGALFYGPYTIVNECQDPSIHGGEFHVSSA